MTEKERREFLAQQIANHEQQLYAAELQVRVIRSSLEVLRSESAADFDFSQVPSP